MMKLQCHNLLQLQGTICFDSATQRVQPTVPTLFLLSDTDQSNNTQIMRAGNNNDSITIINNNNNNNIYANNRSNCITWMEGYHLHNRLLVWSIRNFSKNTRISNIAKYTVKSRFPGKKRHPYLSVLSTPYRLSPWVDILRWLQQQVMNETIFVLLSSAGRKKPSESKVCITM